MQSRSNIAKLIFLIGAIILLLRPYLIYQMTAGIADSNPAKAWNLLQRLVKKKDDHHHENSSVGVALISEKLSFRIQRRILLNFFVFIRAWLKPVTVISQKQGTSFTLSGRSLYRLNSCMLI